MYEAFNPTEMEILAGYIWGCQHIEVPKREKNDKGDIVITKYILIPMPPVITEFDFSRPYTPQERFLEAIKVFVNVKKVKFENCKYHPNKNTVEAIGKMDSKREAASRKIWEAIKDWNESILKSCWEKHKNILTTGKLGFAECPAQPLVISHTISELSDLAENKNQTDIEPGEALTFQEPVMTESVPVGETEKRKPGRPKKNG